MRHWKSVFALGAMVLIPGIATAATIHVPADQPTIQAGIDASGPGDTVLVAPGEYHEHGLDLSPNRCLLSEAGAAATTIDADGLSRVIIAIVGGGFAEINGFTLMNGYHDDNGGAVYFADGALRLLQCVLTANTAEVYGGALYASEASVTVEGNVFDNNWAQEGGGLYLHHSVGTVAGNTITNHHVPRHGGGIYLYDSDVIISGNLVTDNSGGLMGGGFSTAAEARPTVLDNVFLRNDALQGGALYYGPGETTLHGNFIRQNTSVQGGGGVVLQNCSAVFSENAVVGNTSSGFGGGLYLTGSATVSISSSTFSDNSAATLGGGIHTDGPHPTLERSIIAFSSQGEALSGCATLSCCDLFGNAGGDWVSCISGQFGINGNFSADPCFCDPLNGDYTVGEDSPCLPGQHPQGYDCGLIGAYGLGCGATATLPSTWGLVKTLFRIPED